MGDVLLKFIGVSKLFPGVVALDHVTMEFHRGEIHAICGENGAGKSTLIKILTGAYTPTEGTIEFDGKSYESFTPREALDAGITAIYQEQNLVPFLSVAENVFFGREIRRGVFLHKKEMFRQTVELAKEMGVEIDPRARVSDIGVAYAQITEILKAISAEARLLVMDEPSASLTNNEIQAMFQIMKTLRSKGITIIYISHRLEEIFEICDRVSVMRDGKYVSTNCVSDVTQKHLVAEMVGRELGSDFIGSAGASNDVALEVKNLRTDRLKGVSFKLQRGEILGLGGLVGAGRTETARAIFGADRIQSGEIHVHGREVRIRRPADAISSGLGFLTEDRKGQGLQLGLRVRENISFPIMKRLTKHLFLDRKQEAALCVKLCKLLEIKTPSINQQIKFLSGGNQQKVVLARWLATNSEILLFDEPTRGIDVGAKQEIYQLMHSLSAQGKSIIMISSEMPELIGMSDRILVMHEGSIWGELTKDEFDQERVLKLASGM